MRENLIETLNDLQQMLKMYVYFLYTNKIIQNS